MQEIQSLFSFLTKDNERGAHINISGFAMTKNAPNKENAIKLLEYLTGEEAQNTYVNNSYEYPANPKVKTI